MRDFDMHRHGHREHFGGHRLAKPLLMGAVIIAALGLLALCRILFGGLGFRPGMFGMARRRMHERWMQMTPEQREEFMQHRRNRFGHRGHHDRCDWHGRRDERGETRPQPENNPPKSSDAG